MEFNSKDEEISYWKERTENFQNELSIVQEEFHNYQISSKELEQELELQLDDYEAKNKSLLILNEKLNIELENLQIRVLDSSKIFNSQINLLQEELNRVKSDKFTLQKYVRELEQTNDDLERSLRATVTSLQDFEQQLNIALEKNAILENELDEKEALVETVQRLKDEARDLRQDLQVKDLHMNQFQDSMSQHDKDALATSLIEETSTDNTVPCCEKENTFLMHDDSSIITFPFQTKCRNMISTTDKNRIIECMEDGGDYYKLGRQLGIPRNSVKGIMYRYNKFGIISSGHKGGSKSKLSEKISEKLLDFVKENLYATLEEIRQYLASLDCSVSIMTISRFLKSRMITLKKIRPCIGRTGFKREVL